VKKIVKRSPLISRVNYQIKLMQNGEMTQCTTLPIKARVLKMIRTFQMNKGDIIELKVTYKTGVTNSGGFTTKEQVHRALKDWTDSAQLAYVYEGKW
jgi:hypothetical protein